MTYLKYTRSFTNNTGSYVLLGDTSDIIVVGTKKECYTRYNEIEIEMSKWSGIEIVAPGATVSGDYLYDNFVMPKLDNVPAELYEIKN